MPNKEPDWERYQFYTEEIGSDYGEIERINILSRALDNNINLFVELLKTEQFIEVLGNCFESELCQLRRQIEDMEKYREECRLGE